MKGSLAGIMKKDTPLHKNTMLWLMASLTLGLATFFPEPHLWGKLKWIAGGGAFGGEHPMQFMDWFDVALHGSPWVMLLISLGFKLKK